MADDFDPDAYLKAKGVDTSDFDPDAYLNQKPAPAPQGPPAKPAGAPDMGFGNATASGGLGLAGMGNKMAAGMAAVDDVAHAEHRGGIDWRHPLDSMGATVNGIAHLVNPGDHTLSDAYDRNLKFQDEANAVTEKAHPGGTWLGRGISIAAQAGAGAAAKVVAGAPAAVAAAPGLARGAFQAVKSAAPINLVSGFAAGYGNGRGDVQHNTGEGGKAALLSAGLGIPLSVAGYLLARGVGAGVNYLRSASNAAKEETANTVYSALDAKKYAANARNLGNPTDFPSEKTAISKSLPQAGDATVAGRIPKMDSGDVVDGELVPEVLGGDGLETTASRRSRMAAKVGRDIRQAHAILANPEGFSQEDIAAARAVSEGRTPSRGMPHPDDNVRNVRAAAQEPNTGVMSTEDLLSNFQRGGDVPQTTKPSIQDIIARNKEINDRIQQAANSGKPSQHAGFNGEKLLVSPDPSKPGQWRVTRFDSGGAPIGHAEASSQLDALKRAKDYGADFGVPSILRKSTPAIGPGHDVQTSVDLPREMLLSPLDYPATTVDGLPADIAKPPPGPDWKAPQPIPEGRATHWGTEAGPPTFNGTDSPTASLKPGQVRTAPTLKESPYAFLGEMPQNPGSLQEKLSRLDNVARDVRYQTALKHPNELPPAQGLMGRMSSAYGEAKGAHNSIAAGFGAAKGFLGASAPQQRAQLLQQAQAWLQDPKKRAMGYALMKSLQAGNVDAAGAATGSDERQP